MSNSENDPVSAPIGEPAPGIMALGASETREFIRYLAASVFALALDAGTLAFLTSILGVSYLISGTIGFMLGLLVIYLLSISWVFEKRTLSSDSMEFSFFLLIGIVGLLINDILLWVFTDIIGLFYLFSKGISVVAVFSWNFLARKYLLFT